MGMIDRLFRRRKAAPEAAQTFRLLDGYAPVFTSWSGSIYESELVRAAIDAIARNVGKLRLTIQGAAKPELQSKLKAGPNPVQTYYQWLYKTATILLAINNAFILPWLNDYDEQVGYYTVAPETWEIVEDTDGLLWLRFRFVNGNTGSMELYRTGILTRHQYKNDYFGESNNALDETMKLVHLQRQGVEAGVKNAASYRFMARFSSATPDPKDLIRERLRFSKQNFGDGTKSGPLLLFPYNYTDIKQLTAQEVNIDPKQLELIKTNVSNYFGTNEGILQGTAGGDAYSAWYETTIEPIAIQMAEVLTKMTYTEHERAFGNEIFLSTNRVQYMTAEQKQRYVESNLDRGIITLNEARDVLQLPPLPGTAGDIRPIRGEYYNADTGERINASVELTDTPAAPQKKAENGTSEEEETQA